MRWPPVVFLDGKGSIGAWGFSDGIDNAGKWDAVRSGAEEPKDPYMNYLHQNSLVQTHLDDMYRRQGNKIATFATDLPEEAYCDNWIAQNGIDLLDRCPDDQPWFLQINFTGPHDPWDVTHRMKATYAEIGGTTELFSHGGKHRSLAGCICRPASGQRAIGEHTNSL